MGHLVDDYVCLNSKFKIPILSGRLLRAKRTAQFGTRHSPLVPRQRKSCVCHTSEKSPANSFICHTSKNGPPQVPCLRLLRYSPGSLSTSFPQFRTTSTAESQASGMRFCLPSATSHHSRVTSHRHSSYCVHYPAVPQLALNDGSTGKQSRFFRCLNEGQRTAGSARLFAAPGRRSILKGM